MWLLMKPDTDGWMENEEMRGGEYDKQYTVGENPLCPSNDDDVIDPGSFCPLTKMDMAFLRF